MRSLTWDQVVVRRQRRHRLLEPAPPDRLVEVASAVCGIHAQVMASAELSLGLRVAGVTRREVRQELRERRGLVKTYGLRGTVHLFPADELPLWMAALRANQPPEGGDAPDRAGLTPERQDAVIAAIGEALDGRCLTRQALGEELASRLGAWVLEETFPAFGGAWPRWWTAIGEAAVRGVLCFGPNQGNRVTFVRPDQWVAGWRQVDGGSALLEVFRRFVASYGPVSPGDFALWFRMKRGAALELARSLGDQVEEVDVEGYRGLLPAGEDLAEAGELPADGSVLLLPAFDCYVRGGYPRDLLIPPASAARALEGAPARSSGRAGLVGPLPVLLVNGVVVGIWERRRNGRRFDLRVEPFVRLRAGQRAAVQAQAARIGEVLEAPVAVSFGPIDRRPHL